MSFDYHNVLDKTKVEIYHTVGIDLEDHQTEVNLSLDKTWEGEISEEDIEDILGTITGFTGIKVGQEADNSQEISGEITVGQDHVQGQGQIETGCDVSDAENMITLLRIVQALKQ